MFSFFSYLCPNDDPFQCSLSCVNFVIDIPGTPLACVTNERLKIVSRSDMLYSVQCVQLIWIVDTMNSRMRQIHAVIVDIFQPCWAHNMYGPQTPWIWIVRFSSNTFFTFFLWFVEFGKQRAIIKSHILSTSHVHTPTENFMIESEKLFDILSTSNTDGIGWGQIWDGNTSKAMASGETLFPFVHSFPFHCSISLWFCKLWCQFSFSMIIFRFIYSWIFFTLPFICSLHILYVVFPDIALYVRKKRRRELNKAHWILLKALHLDSAWYSDVSFSSCVSVCVCERYLTDLSRRLFRCILFETANNVTKNYNNSNIIL